MLNSHTCETNSEKVKFIGPHNTIKTSIIQAGMKANWHKKRTATRE